MMSIYCSKAAAKRRGPASFDVRCTLKGRRLKDESTSELLVVDSDYVAELTLYVPTSSALTPGLLPGCELLVRGMLVCTAERGQVYGKLSTQSRVVVHRSAAHNFSAAPTHSSIATTPGASNVTPLVRGVAASTNTMTSGPSPHSRVSEAPNLSQVTALAASRPAHICDIRPFGGPESMLRLHVTVRQIFELHLSLRCCACGDVRTGSRCRCPPPVGLREVGQANLEVELTADVTDGTGRAYMQCSGRAVWTLLQAPPTAVRAVRAVTEAAGPLTCKQNSMRLQCLASGNGEWKCGTGLLISDKARQTLRSVWPLPTCWQRDFDAHVMLGRRPTLPALQYTHELIEKQRVRMLAFDPKVIKIIAYDLTPTSASVALERSLEAALAPDSTTA